MLRYAVSEISLSMRDVSLRHLLEDTRSYIQHAVGTKIPITEI
jgi:hypothetical protein